MGVINKIIPVWISTAIKIVTRKVRRIVEEERVAMGTD